MTGDTGQPDSTARARSHRVLSVICRWERELTRHRRAGEHVPTQPPTRVEWRTVDLTGIPFAVATAATAVEWLVDVVHEGRNGISVRFANAYSVVSAHKDAAYLRLMQQTGVSFADGAPVAAALRMAAGDAAPRRVRGPSFFSDALQRMSRDGTRHFLLGTTDPTLDQLQRALARRWPTLVIAGTYAPPFADVDDAFIEACRARIVASDADCVWVALGTPKQDFVAARLAAVVDVPCVAVGAAFDFAAGTKREAPQWIQRLGFEWLFRFGSEPRRLWRRYVIGNVQFLALIASHRSERRSR